MAKKDFWLSLPKPIVGLSPMDGYSDSAFRRVCKWVNPDLVTITEFTSADGLHHNAKTLKKKLQFHPSEQPVIAQIFGKNTETFISATKFCEDMGFSGIDINMGCPSKKVVRSEHGVALRKNHDLAFKLIESVATNTSLPVSVKTRLGWSNADDLITFGLGAQNAGANMLCIHARTYQQPYGVPANWDPVYDLKRHVSIPVLGNGGITHYQQGLSLLQNLDGFLIGQATFGNPWTLSPNNPSPTLDEKIPVILHHAQWLIDNKGEQVGTREIRKHLVHYIKGYKNAKAFRSSLVKVDSFDAIKEALEELLCVEEGVPSL